ncbi:MAG TPA: c-type cytochrome [Gemmatimonadetes bacterium]|nr:c-type cytochrome [Gemmatimonadota bacterium]
MLVENLKILAVVLGTLAVFTLVANSIPQVQSVVPEDLSFGANVSESELTSSGEDLYSGAGGCTACHGLGTVAPNLLTDEGGTGSIGARCANRASGQDCKEYLYASMVEPADYVVEGYGPIMPDMRRSLSNEQIWALVAYLQSVGGEVTVTGADIGTGTDPAPASPAPATAAPAAATTTTASLDPVEIMRANTCFACHVLSGEGAPIGPAFDGMGARVDADYIRRSILDPAAEASAGYEAFAGLMPSIFGGQLTAAQLEIIVQFLASQQ